MAAAALAHMWSTATCMSSRASLGLQHSPHKLLARRPVRRACVLVAASHAAADAAGREQENADGDTAATSTKKQLAAAVLNQQQDGSAADDSAVDAGAPAAGSIGATTAAAAGLIIAAEAKAAAARTDELLGQEHLACTGVAETVRPEAAFDASAEGDEADTPKAAEETEEAVDTADEAEGEDPAAAAEQQGSAVEAGSEPYTADMLQRINSSIAPALTRFGLDDLLVPILQDHLQQHGKFRRSFHSHSIYLSSTCLLCDPQVYSQWCQGVLSCYLLTVWLLGVDQLPLKGPLSVKWRQQGPLALCSSRALVMQMSIAGDLIAAMRSRFGKPGRRGGGTSRNKRAPRTTRELLLSCPWMQLSQPGGNAEENQLSMRLLLLGFAASKERLAELLPLLNGATCAALGVSKAGAAASAGLVAAAASEAVGTTDARKVQQGILAAAAGSAVRYYMNSSPANLGRMWWCMLQRGVPVGVLTLVRFIQDSSPAGQKGRVQAMTAELAAALEAMLATAKPCWVRMRALQGAWCCPPPQLMRAAERATSQLGTCSWVVTVSSAASAAYSSMLQHMAAVSLLGLDTESSWLGDDGSVTVVLSFMAPGVPASDSGCQPGCQPSVSLAVHAMCSACKHVYAGARSLQDLPLLQSQFGLSAVNAIDTQLCYIALNAARQRQGLHVQGRPLMRRKLEGLLGAYGLFHPNKMDVAVTAPRPLSPELLSYLVADVRYLPALVLLTERDLMQVRSTTFWLAGALLSDMAVAAASFQLRVQEQLFQLKLPSPEAVSAGLMPDSRCSMETVQQCVDALLQHQEHADLGGAGTVAAGEAEGESTAAQLLSGSSQRWMTSGLRHFVAPILMPGGRQQRSGEHHNSRGIDGSHGRAKSGMVSGGEATAVQQQQPQLRDASSAVQNLRGLLFSATWRQHGLSLVIGDLLAGITQQALAVNALGGTAQHGQPQLAAAALPPTWLRSRSTGRSDIEDQAVRDRTATQSQPNSSVIMGRQLAAASDIAAWRLGLQPAGFSTSAAAVGSSSSKAPGLLVLLLGPAQSGRDSMLRDMAATLADNSCVSVAAVDMDDQLAGAPAVQSRLLGRALQLQVDSRILGTGAQQAALSDPADSCRLSIGATNGAARDRGPAKSTGRPAAAGCPAPRCRSQLV
ncbi:hypothetical protein COO60DRAFT_1457557 [Scenedesmus sp. NREL 46B-D3]|nr:hypothetical protein COO60DRAFT_1457557 [Scenedesmus sp. NREL 46B-D3]